MPSKWAAREVYSDFSVFFSYQISFRPEMHRRRLKIFWISLKIMLPTRNCLLLSVLVCDEVLSSGDCFCKGECCRTYSLCVSTISSIYFWQLYSRRKQRNDINSEKFSFMREIQLSKLMEGFLRFRFYEKWNSFR